MKMHLRYSCYLLSMVDFKEICSFNALLKDLRIENVTLFLLLNFLKKKLGSFHKSL
jgi:hypothetical protein